MPSLPKATAAPTDAPTATTVPPTATSTTPPTATVPPPAQIPIPPDADKGYRQWAIAAAASSEYGNDAYSAMQATGKTDAFACGAAPYAWSPAEADGIAWLELSYDSPTAPTLIHIFQTDNPSQIVKVELIDFRDNYFEIYTAQPYAFDECPYTLSIPVLDVGYQIRGLRITVDQTLGIGRPAIDAVQVIGAVEHFFIPEPTTPSEVVWQVGSTSPELVDLEFSTFGGMDASDTTVYVADAYNGALMFDFAGAFQGILGLGEVGYVVDVAMGPGGEVYIADAGLRLIAHFDPEGTLINVFGGFGEGDGEFSGDSPAALAVDSDGNVYALDIGDAGTRVQVFTPEGDFIRAFPVEEALGARAMDIGPDDTLFLTGYGGYILELIPDDGRVIQRLGQEVLEDRFPQRLRVDDDGNFYITTWGAYSAVKLDSQGQLLETIGVEATNDGVTGWPPGEFLFPVGIAVTGDGRYLFIGDGFGEFTFLTAYRYL
jgi:sugar lactone lactonase YvrE